ncbi:MAG TPA: hypothetical protein VMW89_18955 [Desulfatiglandales bacterium]|nr:hypothetical protein [Desulfatiglandales bacterium]
MAQDYSITLFLDEGKIEKLRRAALDGNITEVQGRKAITVMLPEKNQRKFRKAFKEATINEQTGEVDKFPQDAADLLFDVVIENKSTEVMHLFLMKAFKPLAGKELRRAMH